MLTVSVVLYNTQKEEIASLLNCIKRLACSALDELGQKEGSI
jgi:hypothetical protein